jgi:repressor LexA
MRDEPTDRQQQILEAINVMTAERGFPPSVREIGERVGLSSSSTVQAHLRTLEKHGLISRDPTKPRALTTTSNAPTPIRREVDYAVLPIIGRVAAGTPITAEENIEGEYVVPPEFARVPGSFLLRVVGDSMIEAGILNGDLIAVHPQEHATDGEIIVALLDDGATVKRFFKENGRIRLQPENHTMSPIYADHVTIVGRVEGLFRKLSKN